MTRFEGYDFSSLLSNNTTMEEIVSPFKEPSKNEKVKLKTEIAIQVDKAMSEHMLHTRLDLFDAILEDLSLSDFWSQLTSMTKKYAVFEELAKERMLNFYEASMYSGLKPAKIRAGMVVSALISAMVIDRDNVSMPMASSVYGVFAPSGVCDIEDFEIKHLTEDDLKELMSAVKVFSRGAPTKAKLKNVCYGDILTEVSRMWIISQNPTIRSMMGLCGDRRKVFGADTSRIRQSCGVGSIHNYRFVDLMVFETRWSRIKTFKFNPNLSYQNFLVGK